LLALVTWIVLGAVIGVVLASVWKLRGLAVGWGIAAGELGGVVGGLIGRTVSPEALSLPPLLAAAVGAVVAMVFARARLAKEQAGTV